MNAENRINPMTIEEADIALAGRLTGLFGVPVKSHWSIQAEEPSVAGSQRSPLGHSDAPFGSVHTGKQTIQGT